MGTRSATSRRTIGCTGEMWRRRAKRTRCRLLGGFSISWRSPPRSSSVKTWRIFSREHCTAPEQYPKAISIGRQTSSLTCRKLSRIDGWEDVLKYYERLCEVAHPNALGKARFWTPDEPLRDLSDGRNSR